MIYKSIIYKYKKVDLQILVSFKINQLTIIIT